jgi:hypothetical protein
MYGTVAVALQAICHISYTAKVRAIWGLLCESAEAVAWQLKSSESIIYINLQISGPKPCTNSCARVCWGLQPVRIAKLQLSTTPYARCTS